MNDDSESCNLSSKNVLKYKEHIKSQIEDDLHDSFIHLEAHQNKLMQLISNLSDAESQVQNSVEKSRSKITESFLCLSRAINLALKTREEEMLQKLQMLETDSLSPLKDCESILRDSLAQTQTLLTQGKGLTKFEDNSKPLTSLRDSVINFQKQAATNNCLPSVPELYSVASVSVAFPPNTEVLVNNIIQQHGILNKQGPVQITNVQEKPGALLVQWEEVTEDDELDDDCSIEKEFILQCSAGDVSDAHTDSYSTVYQGTDNQYLLQQRAKGVTYWLRVTHVIRGEEDFYLPWSLPQRASTSLRHYSWSPDTTNHWRVADCGRLACKHTDTSGMVSSEEALVTPGDSVTLQIISGSSGCSDEGIALAWSPPKSPLEISNPGTLFVTAAGNVIIDGVQRLMQLPSLTVNSTVSFYLESISDSKLRVQIETAEKQVTYEWSVPKELSTDPRLYFCACFNAKDWSVRVY